MVKPLSVRKPAFSLENGKYVWKSAGLPDGYYLFKSLVNDVFYFRTFYLKPYAQENSRLNSYTDVLLPDLPAAYTGFQLAARDGFSGKRLFDAEITVSRNGKVLEIGPDFMPKSGESYDISVKHPDYYSFSWTYTHNFGKFNADIALVPLPGILHIESNTEGLEILIDNSKSGFTGRRKKEYSRYGTTSKNVRVFYLPAGKHTITVRKGSTAEKSIDINLIHDQKIELSAVYNGTDRELQLR